MALNPFAYLRAWKRVRRIVVGRRIGEDGFLYYTTQEAVEADFGIHSTTTDLMSAWLGNVAVRVPAAE